MYELGDCRLNQLPRQPGGLGVLRRVAEGVAEEARTRGFASPALAGFAFIATNIVGSTWQRQFWDVPNVRFWVSSGIAFGHQRPLANALDMTDKAYLPTAEDDLPEQATVIV